MRALGWALALLVHLALLAYAFPLAVVFGDLPYGTPDYQTHYHQVVTLLQALDGLGRLWVYDPTFLAGYPTGLVFDLDNNGLFWFVYLARGLGLATPAAFNLFALVGAAIAPLLVWLASRALGASARAQLWTLWLAVLLWHLDATSHFCRVAGMISFSVSAALCVVALACFDRLLREEARPWPLWTATAISLSLALLIHVWAFATLAAPMIALYVWRARHLRLAAHARVGALAAVALLVNAHWLAPALSQLGVITPSARVGQATPLVLLTDFLELAIDPEATGNTVQRTLLRFLALFGAIAALTEGRRRGAPWALGGALGLGWLLLLTYAGALVPGLRETEPYRFAVPLALWAAVIAGPWCAEHLSLRTLRAQPRWLQACALAALLALAPRALAQITDAIPELSSQPPLPGRAASYRMAPVHPSFLAVAERLKTLPGDGRVLVEWWPLAEYLAWAQERPIVGGFPDRRLPHRLRVELGIAGDVEDFGRIRRSCSGRQQ